MKFSALNKSKESYAELLNYLEQLEHHRKLVKERVASMVRGITDACRQATAFLWMNHKRQDVLGTSVSEYSKPGTVILGDAVLNPKLMWTESDIKKMDHRLCQFR